MAPKQTLQKYHQIQIHRKTKMSILVADSITKTTKISRIKTKMNPKNSLQKYHLI
jgi:hypothetical protein